MDERADSIARKCMKMFAIDHMPIIQLGYRNQVALCDNLVGPGGSQISHAKPARLQRLLCRAPEFGS